MNRFSGYILSLIFLLLIACSAEKNAPLNRAFHNTTSHYNAYYYALENIKAIEERIEESYEPDYDNILPIFISFDTTLVNSYQEQIDEAIKMASLAIQRHQISKWVDDSYILVGLARLYSRDFVNAVKTFKYVYKKSQDPNTKHLAAIHLLRTYTESGESDNAIAVSDILKKEKLNNSNEKLLALNRAYFYQTQENLDKMLQNLTIAATELDNNDGKGRMYFIIGQNYQELGFNAEAFSFYRKCLATNPEYELDFFARLKMAQVTELTKNSDIKTVRKHFRKLLKDKKNIEFRDKIYYEMAEFESKQSNLEEAIEYYNLSVRSSIKNQRQKGISYLKLGKIYYDTLRDYTLAESYYDSSLQVMPKDYKDYEAIKERHIVLKDFVTQLITIQTQDSLLNLSKMDSMSLISYLNDHLDSLELAEELRREKEKSRAKRASSSPSNIFASANTSTSNKWYFGNPAAVALGQTEFVRVWGDIELADDWRRSTKEASNYNEDEELADISVDKTGTEVNGTEMAEADRETQVAQLLATIPFSEKDKEKALGEIEEAFFKLGNIYHFQLFEDLNAVETFEELLQRFNETDHKIETYYLLYLIYSDLGDLENSDKYKNILLEQYPETTYAKLILNPNYNLESSIAEEKLKLVYADAYAYYQKGLYKNSLNLINSSLKEYDELAISDKLKLLKVLITGKTEDITQYQFELSEFVKNNQGSELIPFAQNLLKASRDFQNRVNKTKGIEYIEYFEQEHYLVIVHDSKKNLADKITRQLDQYNENNATSQNLKTSNLILTESQNITMVSEFAGARGSTLYYEDLIMNPDIKQNIPLTEIDVFVISKDNFTIFYQSKELKKYVRFFNKHYL